MEGEPTYVSKPLPTPAFPFSFQVPGNPYTIGDAKNVNPEPDNGGNGNDSETYVTNVTWNGAGLVIDYSDGQQTTILFSDCP